MSNLFTSNTKDFGFVRVAGIVPVVEPADVEQNVAEMIKWAIKAAIKDGQEKVRVAVFPELGITGYTCKDLFHQGVLLRKALDGLKNFVAATEYIDTIFYVGLPLMVDGQLFNVAAVCFHGKVLAFIPKSRIPNYREFEESRWFRPASNLRSKVVTFDDYEVPIGTDILIDTLIPGLTIGAEICEDGWMPDAPSRLHVLNGATVNVNLSASNVLIGKAAYRHGAFPQLSADTFGVYIYTSAGPGESTADLVFDGDAMIAENGKVLAESRRFQMDGEMIVADIDVEFLMRERMVVATFGDSVAANKRDYRYVQSGLKNDRQNIKLQRPLARNPFVPDDLMALAAVCEQSFNIAVMGTVWRLKKLAKKLGKKEIDVYFGNSGGLDSALLTLIATQAFKILGWDLKHLHARSLPGFGTTKRTQKNARAIPEKLGLDFAEIDIRSMCLEEMHEMGHKPFGIDLTDLSVDEFQAKLSELPEGSKDLVFENIQARMRTSVLMNLGFVLGTGDLTEIALGWSTYNGDHMSMYNPNCGMPKTLIRSVLLWATKIHFPIVLEEVQDVVKTPISPELLPAKDGEIAQKSEDTIGPYDLNDFFVYHVVRNGEEPAKIAYLAEIAFNGDYDKVTIIHWLKKFYERFATAQFKRDAAPDGPKTGSVGFSQRGDWRMPSDVTLELWIKEVEKMIAASA